MKTFNHVEQRKKLRFTSIVIILAILILLMFIVSMNTGYIRMAPLDVLKTLFGGGTSKQELILFDFRLPRIVIAILVGAGLATAGAILQGVTKNGLADPGILGINAGAGLAVILFISYYPSKETAPVYIMPVLALLGAGLTALIIYLFAYKKSDGLSPIRLILVGIAVAAGVYALTLVLTIRLSPENFQFVYTWLAGNIGGTDWKFVVALLPWIVILIPFSIYKSKVLNVMSLGDQVATGLGISLKKEQMWLMITAVGLAGSCVAVGGGIGFLGLIGPHLARRLVGPKHQYMLPVSALLGSLLLVTADAISRTILQPTEIPVGIVVAVIGAPYFLFLLVKTK